MRMRTIVSVLITTCLAAGFLLMVPGLAYRRWAGRACGEFAAGSERHEVCMATGADRAQVCFNLENVPFMCSAEFLRGHPQLLQLQLDGLAAQRRDCAAAHGRTDGCVSSQWRKWCAEHYGDQGTRDKTGGEDGRRHDRCVAPGGG